MEIVGAAGGLVAAIAALFSFLQARKARRIAQVIELDKIVDEAWDLMGGKKGAFEVTERVAGPSDLEEARRRLRDARKINSRSSRVARVQGVLYWLEGNLSAAEASFKEAVKLSESPKDLAASYSNLGNRQYEEGRMDDAIVSYLSAIEAAPENWVFHYNLAGTYLEQGNLENAVSSFKHALERYSHSTLALVNLARAQIDLGEFQEADENLQKALSIEPSDPEAHFQLGRLQERQHDLDGARKHFRKALDLKPDYREASEALEMLGRPTPRREADGSAAAPA